MNEFYPAPEAENTVNSPAPAVEKPVCPPENSPLSPWSYFGLQILFSVPIIGFIFLIIFSCKSDNINRRNFARSYWCSLIIVGILLVVILIVATIFGAGAAAVLRS